MVVKIELFDVDAMERLLTHDGISKDVKKRLQVYKRRRMDGNKVQIIYEYGKKVTHAKLGRLYPQKGIGLQNFPSDIRACLAKKYYWDIDMVNSQPNILFQIAQKSGWRCLKLKEYVTNRSEKLEELMRVCQIDRSAAKDICISLMFGAKYNKVPPFILELQDELEMMAINIVNANPDVVKTLGKGANAQSIVAHVLQSQEFQILQFIDIVLRELGRQMDVYIHDGGHVLRFLDEATMPRDILDKVEEKIAEKFGFSIKLEVKPLEHSFVFSKDDMRTELVSEKDYQAQKALFETNHFLCEENATICRIENDGSLTQFPIKNMGVIFSDFNFVRKNAKGIIKTESFIYLWCNDPYREKKRRLVFNPSRECSDDEYNLFTGFLAEQYTDEIDEKTREQVIDRWEELIRVNSDYDEEQYTYQMKWFALLVQKPHIRPEVALIWQNSDQGTGKDITFNFVGEKIIGARYYCIIRDVEQELFDTHSTAREGKILLKIEEADGFANRKYSNRIKSDITGKTVTVNPKNFKKYELAYYPHYGMTTNMDVPVFVEKSDRRFDIIATSSKYMGDSDFWDKTVKLFELPGAGRMVYDYLMKIDLVGWKHSIFPKTAYHALLSDTEIPPEVRFIKECKPFNDLNGEAFYQMYNDWCTTHRIVIRKSFPVMRKIIAPMVGKVFTVNRKTDGNLYSKADVEEKGRIK